MRAYVETFPREAEAVARLVRGIGLAWPVPDVPEIWLANDRFRTGTTLFDQFRAAPRMHTFDLNAASVVDLMSVGGVSMEIASAIRHGAPYAALEDVGRVPGVTQEIVGELRGMQSAMAAVRQANERDDGESIDLMRIFAPVIWRVTFFIALASLAAAWLYGRARRVRLARRAANGLAASVVGLLSAWIFAPPSRFMATAPIPRCFLFYRSPCSDFLGRCGKSLDADRRPRRLASRQRGRSRVCPLC